MIYTVGRRASETSLMGFESFRNYRQALSEAAHLAKIGFETVTLDKHNGLTGRCEPMAVWDRGQRVTPGFDVVSCAH